eukprot:gene36477-49130_t
MKSKISNSIPQNGDNVERDKERRLAEERAATAHKLQRKQRLEALVEKRKNNFSYLRKIHQGDSFWLNTALFSKKDVRETIVNMVPKQRTESFFFLGMSISKITTYIVGLQA